MELPVSPKTSPSGTRL